MRKHPIQPGMKYGRLVTIERLENDPHSNARWLVHCDCGTEKIVGAPALLTGKTLSCGCYSKDINRARRKPAETKPEKTCSKCGVERPLSDFYVRNVETGRKRDDCRFCCVAMATRWVATNKEKRTIYNKAWYEKNATKVKGNVKRWSAENNADARYRQTRENYRKANRADCNARIRKWKKVNPAKVALHSGTRKSIIKIATPAWTDWDEMAAIYSKAARLTAETGVQHHVDHVVPLKDRKDRVCGLHSHTNLCVLTASENLKKNNHYWPDMPEDAHG